MGGPLLGPTLRGLGSGRFLCRRFASCLLLGLRAGFSSGLRASAAVVEVAAVAPGAGLLVLTTFAALILLVLFAVPHRSGTGRAPAGDRREAKHRRESRPARANGAVPEEDGTCGF